MTMPVVPIIDEFPITNQVLGFSSTLASALVTRGVIPSVDHVVYGPGAAHENDPPAPRVSIEFADDFAVTRPIPGRTNPGIGLVAQMEQDDLEYEMAARSVYQIEYQMLITIWARTPESGQEDSKDTKGMGPAILAKLALMELKARVLSVFHDVFNLDFGSGGASGKFTRAAEQDEQYGAACTIVVPFYTQVPGSDQYVKVSEQVPMESDMFALTDTDEFLVATVNNPSP